MNYMLHSRDISGIYHEAKRLFGIPNELLDLHSMANNIDIELDIVEDHLERVVVTLYEKPVKPGQDHLMHALSCFGGDGHFSFKTFLEPMMSPMHELYTDRINRYLKYSSVESSAQIAEDLGQIERSLGLSEFGFRDTLPSMPSAESLLSAYNYARSRAYQTVLCSSSGLSYVEIADSLISIVSDDKVRLLHTRSISLSINPAPLRWVWKSETGKLTEYIEKFFPGVLNAEWTIASYPL